MNVIFISSGILLFSIYILVLHAIMLIEFLSSLVCVFFERKIFIFSCNIHDYCHVAFVARLGISSRLCPFF